MFSRRESSLSLSGTEPRFLVRPACSAFRLSCGSPHNYYEPTIKLRRVKTYFEILLSLSVSGHPTSCASRRHATVFTRMSRVPVRSQINPYLSVQFHFHVSLRRFRKPTPKSDCCHRHIGCVRPSVRLCVCQHGTTWLSPDGFTGKMTLDAVTKMCPHIPVLLQLNKSSTLDMNT